MRELKFRVWDEKYNTWDDSSIELIPQCNLRKQGRVIQQYTGLRDKNDKEIYEGDILTYDGEIAEIVYSNSSIGFVINSSGRHNIDEKYGDYIPLHSELFKEYTAVGNIFENPELLK